MNSIYVENLPEETSEEDVMDMFANAGHVSFVSVDRDAEAGGSKKVAYVHFDDAQAAQNAIDQYDNQHILDDTIRVSLVDLGNDAEPSPI
ncbi:Protein R09B3.3 [Aphelenchoides avenae]|nr:Protein R09B3.3 [Aphelenchus avenae]